MDTMITAYRIIDAWRSVFGEYSDAAFIVAVIVVGALIWRLLLLLQQSGSLLFDLVMLAAFVILAQLVAPEHRLYVWLALGVLIALRIATATRAMRSPPQQEQK